jgi:hypothetical protein
VAIGAHETDPAAIGAGELVTGELAAAGLELSSDTVLTASALSPPSRPGTEAAFRTPNRR